MSNLFLSLLAKDNKARPGRLPKDLPNFLFGIGFKDVNGDVFFTEPVEFKRRYNVLLGLGSVNFNYNVVSA